MRKDKCSQTSVIMTVFNAENYLKQAIESVLAQTFADFEFIIVDDCSSDRSVEIIESYRDNRIILLKNEENQGVSNSRNYAHSLAKGEYIAVMDSDDICHPKRLENEWVENLKSLS